MIIGSDHISSFVIRGHLSSCFSSLDTYTPSWAPHIHIQVVIWPITLQVVTPTFELYFSLVFPILTLNHSPNLITS